MIESLVATWGYLAVAIGTLFEGEAVLLVAGALAHRGLLDPRLVALCAFGGSVLGDQVWFHAGRHWGKKLLASHPRWAERAARVEHWIGRWRDGFVVAFRFLYGLRIVSPVVLGTTSYSSSRFALFNAIGGAAWAIAFTAIGWAVGTGVEAALGRTAQVEEAVLGGLVLAVVLGVATRARRARHRADGPQRTSPG